MHTVPSVTRDCDSKQCFPSCSRRGLGDFQAHRESVDLNYIHDCTKVFGVCPLHSVMVHSGDGRAQVMWCTADWVSKQV